MRFSFWPAPSQPYDDVLESGEPRGGHRLGRSLVCRSLHAECGGHLHTLAGSLDHPGCARRSGAASAPGHAGHRQYLSPPGRARQDGGDPRSHQRRPGGARHRQRLAGERTPAVRHPVLHGRGTPEAAGRSLPGDQVAVLRNEEQRSTASTTSSRMPRWSRSPCSRRCLC